MKIGIFDSGFGGLSIMRAVVQVMPHHDYIYLGDTARTPYGTRSQEMVRKFTQQAINFLFAQGAQHIIIACNTASAEALQYIQKRCCGGERLTGVIAPTIMEAVQQTKNGKIGVLATEGTVASGAFVHGITRENSDAVVVQSACPLFVPLVENGEREPSILRYYSEKYTKPLREAGVDTIILGCTHYEFLAPIVQSVVGEDVCLICEGAVVAWDFAQQFPCCGSACGISGTRTFFTTDDAERFNVQGSFFYGSRIVAQNVQIDCLPQ